MICETIKGPNGPMIVCYAHRRRAALKPCHHCGRPSSALCDFPLHVVIGKPDGSTIVKTTACDAPICAACSRHEDPDLDYCTVHPMAIPAPPAPTPPAQRSML